VDYLDRILGAAIFDLSGLPRDYFISNEGADLSWVQTIFQALGLQALLDSSFRLTGFRHALIQSAHFQAVIVRRPDCYLALLVHQNDAPVLEDLIEWATDFDYRILVDDPRFSSG
jgi:hypothetical protein